MRLVARNGVNFLVVIIALQAKLGLGQNYVDLVKLNFQTTPQNSFIKSTAKTKVNEFGAELAIPIKLGESAVWFTNAVYDQTSVKLYQDEDYQNLKSLTIRTGLIKQHTERLTGTYLLVPRISSDSDSPGRDGFQFGGLVLFKVTRSDHLNVKAGLFASSDFFSPFVTPLLGFYRLSEDKKWEINALLPAALNVNRVLIDGLDAGLNFNGQIKGFRLNEIPATGQAGYLVRSSNEICSYLKWRIAKNIFVQARAGISIGRSYRVYDADDKLDFAISFIKFNNNRTQLNTDFSNGWVGQVGLFYRIPTP
jgi:hypothetical protein